MKPTKPKTIYLAVSQDVTLLYPLLKQALFLENNFFQKRIVLLENAITKHWLQLQMAEDPDLHIAMGVEFLDGERVFEALLTIFYKNPPKTFPGKRELALLIQEWGKEEGIYWGKSCRIAEYFTAYSRFGGDPMPGYLQSLWDRMVAQYGWVSHQEALRRVLKLPIDPVRGSLHFFSPRLFTKEEVVFLDHLAQILPVWVYQFSPCELFWSDLCSDRESAHLLRHWEKKTGSFAPNFLQLQELLADRHPLLANLGSVGRRMAREWEASSAQSFAYYPKVEPPGSLLQQVQQDVLSMSLPQQREADSSIQLYGAMNARQEVEMVYQILVEYLETHKELEPKDCAIFVSQPSLYMPHLQAVFGRPNSSIPYAIYNEPSPPKSLLRIFQTLLMLKDLRWEKSNLKALLEQPSFQMARRFSYEDATQIKQWIDRWPVDWGIDVDARKKWLENWGDVCVENEEKSRTWEGVFEQVALSSVWGEVESSFSMDFSQLELLGRWRDTLWELFDALKPWREDQSLSMREWSEHLLSLSQQFLEPDPTMGEESKEWAYLLQLFAELPRRFAFLLQEKISADSLYKLLSELWDHSVSSAPLQAVEIGPFAPVISKKILFGIGMGEGDFPRKESLFLIQAPSTGDLDRYLLLELLFGAKETLFFSYSRSTVEGTNQGLSPILKDFFSFLGGYGAPIVEKGALLRSVSIRQTKNPRFFLEKELKIPLKPLESVFLPQEIPLSKMRSAFRNPISCYCEKQWGFSFPPYPPPKKSSPCRLDGLAKFSIRESFLFHPLEEALSLPKNQPFLPKGSFALCAREELSESFSKMWGYLSEEGVEMGEIFSVELTPRVQVPMQSSSHLWLFPPLPIPWQGSYGYVTGKIPFVSQKGLVFPRKGDWKTIWRVWPEFLVYCGLVQYFQQPWALQVLFTETTSTKRSFFEEAVPHLGRAGAFSTLAIEQPCPLFPDWMPSFIQGDVRAFQEALEEFIRPFSATGDEGWWKWIFDEEAALEKWVDQFGPCARALGEDLYKAWGKK